MDKLNLKFIWKFKGIRIACAILKNKNIVEKEEYFKHYKAIAIKTVWYWSKDRYIDQWNVMENAKQTLTFIVN